MFEKYKKIIHEMTAEEFGTEGKYAKYFAEESPAIYGVTMGLTRKLNPKLQSKTVKQPFYRQLEKKKWY